MMRKKSDVIRKALQSAWFGAVCMVLGGIGSVELSRSWTVSFYTRLPQKEEDSESVRQSQRKIGELVFSERKILDLFQIREEPPKASLAADSKGGRKEPQTSLQEKRKETDFPDRLNSISYFEEGASKEDSSQSVAGRIYQSLSDRDSAWIHEIYHMGQIPIEEMQIRLGLQEAGVKEWTRINITFYDGDGVPISGYSNAKEILSLASVYGYYTHWKDYDSFHQYADRLWDSSHSYAVSASDLYFCEGNCLYIEESESDETENQQAGEESQDQGPDGDSLIFQESSTEYKASWEKGPGVESVDDYQEDETQPAEGEMPKDGETEALETEFQGETAPPESREESNESAIEQESESAPDQGGGHPCQGHRDLNVSATIIGLRGERNLFAVDLVGKEERSQDSQWNGWDLEPQSYVQALTEQDWYGLYNLSASASMYVQNPLTSSEIGFYMNLLPENISQKRRAVVKEALLSVGCIPYYWGGKPYGGGFDRNGFGTIVAPDEDGRVLRGLDCSGWINWVYWTTFGSSLPAESTSGLMSCGRGIQKEALQAGDILVRGGEDRHVYMFLAWAENGSMYLIHETTGTFNNVTVDIYDVDVQYYRNLIGEE